jgi:tetratricopeptide (TPR) repeat protein
MATYDKEFIVRYAEDELAEEEKRQFETDLQKDPSLAAELSLYRELKVTLQQRLPHDATGEALRSTLSDLNKTHFESNAGPAQTANPAQTTGPTDTINPTHTISPTDTINPAHTISPAHTIGAAHTIRPARRLSTLRWMTAAAAACVVVATVLLWPSHNEDAFDRLGHTEMVSTTERGANTDTLLQQAAPFFNRQEFAKALPLLDRAVRADSSSQLALFYRGVASWHTGAIEAARQDLEQVYNGESLLRYEAAFYMALSYATQKNKTAAEEWLKKIPEGTPVSGRAKELESKLK